MRTQVPKWRWQRLLMMVPVKGARRGRRRCCRPRRSEPVRAAESGGGRRRSRSRCRSGRPCRSGAGRGGARSGPGRAGGSDQTIAEEGKELGKTMPRGPDRGARSRAAKVGGETELTGGVGRERVICPIRGSRDGPPVGQCFRETLGHCVHFASRLRLIRPHSLTQ